MNKKNIISFGSLFIVLAIGAGVAYYLDPGAINNMFSGDPALMENVSDTDISAIDIVSSTPPALDPENDGTVTASSAKKTPSKEKSVAASGVAEGQATALAAQGAVAPPPPEISDTGAAGSADSAIDDGILTAPAPSSVTASAASACQFPLAAPSTTKEIIFNEVAWMGTPSSSAAEWMEIKNNSASDVDLSGWEAMNASGKIKIVFGDGDAIAPEGLFLLSRGNPVPTSSAASQKIYAGDLVNTGDVLALMDPQCNISDYLDASKGWPAGNNTTKQTMERDADGSGWHASALPGGTPGAENSAGPAPAHYALEVAFEGDAGGATIASDPAGLTCAAICTGSYASGTLITLTPTAGPNVEFGGWSGLCYGQTTCSFTITTTTSIAATFTSTLPSPSGEANVDTSPPSVPPAVVATSSTDGQTPATTTAPVATENPPGHILIALVQVAGASSDNDLVKLYNPTALAVDMSGWKLHKKSATGGDYSLKEFPTGSIVAPGQSFVWANSGDGFSETVDADVSSTETLSADNSVALMDASGNIVDAVAWGTGSGQYGEGPPYPTNPGANQTLTRRSSDGVMVDTDDNTNDFILQ
jgi:hypothetical protein